MGQSKGGVRFALLAQPTDAEQDWAYARESAVCQLDKALDIAQAVG
jgi:hypothetical protein